MATVFMEYRRSGKMKAVSFKQYLQSIGFTDPAANVDGMDDAAQIEPRPEGPQLINIPALPVIGKLRVKVLLIDFTDRPGVVPAQHYNDMLFTRREYPTGSMRDFYNEVTLGKVDLEGSVHGWLRMPKPYSFYTNNQSGIDGGEKSYPNNAQRMAEDAVTTALGKNVPFEQELDKLNQGIVTALFIIHAGRGAERVHPSIKGTEIWSHKWTLKNIVDVGNGLSATIYLAVPHDCKVGVCCHELGHLAFQWQDFYAPRYEDHSPYWAGSGVWDLMASGSWNGDGSRPAHPAGLHKIQHGWVPVTTVTTSSRLTIKPYTAKTGRVYKIVSSKYGPKQYLLLENRKRGGFDFNLPGEGLLAWRVDENEEIRAMPDNPGLLLIQADGKHNLEQPENWNSGDGGDPFPGTSGTNDAGEALTSFPGGKRSGVSLKHIAVDPESGNITLHVKFVDD